MTIESNKLNDVLEFILTEIKRENDSRDDGTTMSQDSDNEHLINIFHDAKNKFIDLDFDIKDTEDSLCELFKLGGYHSIIDAQSGLY